MLRPPLQPDVVDAPIGIVGATRHTSAARLNTPPSTALFQR